MGFKEAIISVNNLKEKGIIKDYAVGEGHYIKNTKKFWKKRNKARIALDKERAEASPAQKIEITERMRKDRLLFKSAKVIYTKSS